MARSRTQVAFLLSQLGVLSAQQFAERTAVVDLTPPQSGLLRLIKREPGSSQREMADRLGAPPSRLVALVDDLEGRGLVERRRSSEDRRTYELHLTDAGEGTLVELGRVSAEHEAAVTAGLSAAERAELEALLLRLAQHRGLADGVHPGYRRLGP